MGQSVIPSGDGGAVSLKPVLDDVRALTKQVEALAAVKASAAADNDSGTKLVLDEIKGLSSQIDGLRQDTLKPLPAPSPRQTGHSTPPAPDYTDALQDIRDQVRALNAKAEKQEQKAPKALVDEIRALSASIQAQEPSLRRALGEEVRSAIATLQSARAESAEGSHRGNEVAQFLHSGAGADLRRALRGSSLCPRILQAEPKAPKGLLEE